MSHELKQVDVRLKLTDKESMFSREVIDTPEKAVSVLAPVLAELDREEVCVVNLDGKGRPINFSVVSIGSVNTSFVTGRELYKSAILSNAAAMIMLHNHPSSDLKMSMSDRNITEKMMYAGILLDIDFYDHIIVAGRTGEFIKKTESWSNVIYMPCKEENGFAPELPEETPDIIYLCFPNNPTGAVYTCDTLTRLANVLREANAQRDPENPIMLISDEPYREIVYGAEVPWVPSIYEHTIVCYSYSKSLSLPGERVGWILVPNTNPQAARLMPAVAGAARTLGFVCAPALFQRVIIDCIDEPSDVEAYARNRTALTDALAEYGYTYVEPDGAFYLWVKALEPDANAFCERAKKYELLAVPSDSFGMPGWFRLGYCVSYETIINSLPAWKQLADEYR